MDGWGVLEEASELARRGQAFALATVGGPAAFVNAVLDAIKDTGVRNIDMPLLPDRVFEAMTERHDVSGAPPMRTDD